MKETFATGDDMGATTALNEDGAGVSETLRTEDWTRVGTGLGEGTPRSSARLGVDTRLVPMQGQQASKGLLHPLWINVTPARGIVAICAEPGMGAQAVLERVATDALDEGRVCLRHYLGDVRSELACSKILRLSREMANAEETGALGPVVMLEDIPAADERITRREARAIMRIAQHASKVVISVLPETEQLVEAITGCYCLHADELLWRCADETSTLWELTGGIPSLVRSMGTSEGDGSRCAATATYRKALSRHVGKLLRDGLPTEELRVRLAMILLGRGSLADVSLATGRCDHEQLQWLARDVPLLGIDVPSDSFACVALTDDELLAGCLGALQRLATCHKQLVVSVCGILAARGDACRSAVVCRLCADPQDLAQVGCTWGVDYVNAGASGIVENACKLSASLELGQDLQGKMSKVALAVVSGSGRELDEALAAVQDIKVTSSLERRDMEHVRLMADSRNFLRSPLRPMRQTAVDASDSMGTFYLDHIHALRLLSMGRFGEAYAFMSGDMLLHEAKDLPSALLCDDLYLATMLTGAAPDARERALFDSARHFYERGQLSRLQHYHAACEVIPAVLMGLTQDAVAIEEAAIRAERAGDVYLHAVFMAVLAVRDIRLRAFSRAHVRASRAAVVGRSLEQEYLASGAEFVDALALEQMGEVGALGDYCATGDRMRGYVLLGRIAAHVMREGPGPEVEMIVPMGTPCPREVLWAVDLLAYGCGRVSDSFRSSLPSAWTDLLLKQKGRLSEVFDGELPMPAEEAAKPAYKPAPIPAPLDQGMQVVMPVEQGSAAKVRIAVFGGLSVEVDGKVVRDTVFDRRRAREFVLLLAVVREHRMRRFHLIAVLWPEADFYRGPRKLYEAASEARKALGGSQRLGNAVVADRAQGSLGFDPTLVSCDVDDFEREAHLALSEDGDDLQILEHARRAQHIYGSGPDVRLLSLGTRVRERLNQLEDLYVDTLVVAGEAALRMNKAKLAVRLAQDAHSRAELREDVMMLLIRALPATGRTHEIKSLYRHYARRLIEQEGMPPSPALRQAVEEALRARRDADTGTLTA